MPKNEKKFTSVFGSTVIVGDSGANEPTLEVQANADVVLSRKTAWAVMDALEAIAGPRPEKPSAADHPLGALVGGDETHSKLVKIAKDSWVVVDTDDTKTFARSNSVSVYRDDYIDTLGYEVAE